MDGPGLLLLLFHEGEALFLDQFLNSGVVGIALGEGPGEGVLIDVLDAIPVAYEGIVAGFLIETEVVTGIAGGNDEFRSGGDALPAGDGGVFPHGGKAELGGNIGESFFKMLSVSEGGFDGGEVARKLQRNKLHKQHHLPQVHLSFCWD